MVVDHESHEFHESRERIGGSWLSVIAPAWLVLALK
jgi:hypothetical protein